MNTTLSERSPSLVADWLAMLAYGGLTSIVFALVFEWSRQEKIVGWNSVGLDLTDRALLLWVLVAKTLLLLLPFLLLAAPLLVFKWRRSAWVVYWVGWMLGMSWMAVDLLLMGFSGNHAGAYVPFLYDMIRAPEKNYGHWVGGGITYVMVGVPFMVAAWGVLTMAAVKWAMGRLTVRFPGLCGRASLVGSTMTLVGIMVLVAPALALFTQPSVLRRMDYTLPLYLSFLESGANASQKLLATLSQSQSMQSGVRICSIRQKTSTAPADCGQVRLCNTGTSDADLTGWRLQDRRGTELPLSGVLKASGTLVVSIPENNLELDHDGRVALVNPDGWPRHIMSSQGKERFPDRSSLDRALAQTKEFLEEAKEAARDVGIFLQHDRSVLEPADTSAVTIRAPQPNVALIVLESFRHSAVSPEIMPELDAWSHKGLRLLRHYSGSNCTHLGFFALLYGRVPVVFDQTLDRQIQPQLCESMKLSGYERWFLTGGAYTGFRRMSDFINDRSFDHIVIEEESRWKDSRDWPEADGKILDQIRRILTTPQPKPQFVVTLLLSTHCPYVYPPEFQVHNPDGGEAAVKDWTGYPPEVLQNRYKNAALFLEKEVMKLVRSLDMTRNIIVVTGDHGESFGEDGFHSHTGPPSEIQTRVPFMMVGAGITPAAVHTATGHTDLLPTLLHYLEGNPVPIRCCHGRDLLLPDKLRDEALIAPIMWPNPGRLVLVQEDRRLALTVKTHDRNIESVEFAHFLDDSGLYQLRHVPRPPSRTASQP